jgi:carbon monoxide dehydrogenase subunit G
MTLRLPVLTLLAAMAGAPSATAQAIPPCQTVQARHDRLAVRCPWPADAMGLRFEAHFAGSHDDTEASLAATLDGTPLACAAGSKTRIDSTQDEGDVTLSCQLSAPVGGGAARQLVFQLRWYHARYTGFEVRAAPGH